MVCRPGQMAGRRPMASKAADCGDSLIFFAATQLLNK
jgi:hypothetical protein